MRKQTFLFLFLVLITFTVQYKPIVYLHGLFDSYQSFFNFEQAIKKRHPDTKVFALNTVDRIGTAMIPLFKQVEIVSDEIRKLQRAHNFTSFHFCGFSQGGIIGRAMLMTQNFQVESFLTIATPAFGEFGFPTWFGVRRFIVEPLREHASKFIYNEYVQKNIGLSWIWHDPKRKREYLTKNLFLPLINNEIPHPKNELFKRNFLKIKRYVIFGSDGDEIVDPWQSVFYGFFNETMQIVPMEEQEIYKRDTFGLLTLRRENRLHIHFEKGVIHLAWVVRDDLIDKIIKYFD